jgi:hypothetical protein
MAYDANKAAEFNKLRQQGLTEDQAAAQAGITNADFGNYAIGDNGQMGPIVAGSGKVAGVDYQKYTAADEAESARFTAGLTSSSNFEQVDYAQTPKSTPGTVVKSSYTTTSTETVSGGGSTTVVLGRPIPTEQSQKIGEQVSAKDAEIKQWYIDNPSNRIRQQQGLPPLTAEENDARLASLGKLQRERNQLADQQSAAELPSPSQEIKEPNTTTTTQTVSVQSSSSITPVNADYDQELNQNTEIQLSGQTRVVSQTDATNTTVQESVYSPYGREEVGPPQNESVFDPRQDVGENVFDPNAATPNPDVATAALFNGPQSALGLPQLPGSFSNILSGFGKLNTGFPSIDNALGTIQSLFGNFLGGGTGGGSGLSSLFTNFSSTVGGLFGGKPTASPVAATTGSSVAASAAAVAPTGPGATQPAVNPASDPSQFPAYDDEGNLQPGFAINEETGQTYYKGVGPATKDTAVNPASDPSQFPAYDDEGNLQSGFKINEETGQPYYAGYDGNANNAQESVFDPRQDPGEHVFDPGQTYNGPATGESVFDPRQDAGENVFNPGQTFNANGESVFDPAAVDVGGPTTAQVQQQDRELAADAAKLYPGTQNQALLNIDKGYAAIEQNNAGIANAEKIIEANNAELADPNISDARRAELLDNNAQQQDYIQTATENSAIQQNIIEQNANVYAAGGGNEGDGQSPTEVSALTDPGIQENVFDPGVGQPQMESVFDPTQDVGENVFDPGQTYNGPATEESVFDPTQDVGENVFDPGQTFNANEESVFDPANVDPNSDPFEQARFEAQQALDNEQPAELTAEDVPVLSDEEVAQAEERQAEERRVLAEQATDVEPGVDPGENVFDPGQTFNAGEESVFNPDAVDANQGGLELPPGAEPDGPPQEEPYALNPDEDAGVGGGGTTAQGSEFGTDAAFAAQEKGSQEAATKALAQKQATIQARYKQPGNTDWRVRLSLAPGAKYLYNAENPGILAPLRAGSGTDGVIFPYTPTISTQYTANYEQYDLVHSNYRGLFYKNSRVGDIQIRGTFTAQNTTEANYLLAVIHFFRSATKMFYGQDPQRGTPPPVCLLNGFGEFQFSDHPVVISSFNYTLPNDVDYIRTTNPNNFGLNLANRYNPSGASLPAGGNLAGLNRLINALLPKGAQPQTPAPNTVVGSVTNNTPASYVPTKMEIDITLIPAQTRAQISKQFSLQGFANGDLLKGGFW